MNHCSLINKDFSKLRKKQNQIINENNLFLQHFHKNNLKILKEFFIQ